MVRTKSAAYVGDLASAGMVLVVTPTARSLPATITSWYYKTARYQGSSARGSCPELRTQHTERFHLRCNHDILGDLEWQRRSGRGMSGDGGVLTPRGKVVEVGPGVAPCLPCVITVEGEPEQVRLMRLILTRDQRASAREGSSRSRLVYNLCSTGPWTYPSWMRKNSHAATHARAMEASATRQWLSQGPSMPE